MKIHFDHINGFGKITDTDLIYSDTWGEPENGDDPDVLLSDGWIPWNGVWYNIRSVRIDLDRYRPSKSTRRQHKKVAAHRNREIDPKHLETMYASYCRQHGFRRTITIKQLLDNSDENLQLEYDGRVVGYSLFLSFPKSIVTLQFITDFSVNGISVGNIAQHYECLCGVADRKRFVYILGGYEKECIYKSSFHGMEWWTGSEWSSDIELYKELCERDSRIQVKL